MKRRLSTSATWFWLVGYLLATSTAALFHDPHAHGSADCSSSSAQQGAEHEHRGSHDACLAGHHHHDEPGDDQESSRPTSDPTHSCAVCDYLAQASAPVVVVAAPEGSAAVRPVVERHYGAPAVGARIEFRSRAPPALV
jgi:hypothetical protein